MRHLGRLPGQGEVLSDLPVGASLDPSGTFYWQPGPGFAGRFPLLFVRTDCQRAGGAPSCDRHDPESIGSPDRHANGLCRGEVVGHGAVRVDDQVIGSRRQARGCHVVTARPVARVSKDCGDIRPNPTERGHTDEYWRSTSRWMGPDMNRIDACSAGRGGVDRPSRNVERLIDRREIRRKVDCEQRARDNRDVDGPNDAEPTDRIDPPEQRELIGAWRQA